jgi:hypothetical protein
MDLNKKVVLCLNGNFMRIGWKTPADAFGAMMGESSDGSPPALALDIRYKLDKDGSMNTEKMAHIDRFEWEYWMILEPREGLDSVIKTTRGDIRIPTILICPNYREMVMKEIKPTSRALREQYKNRCAYSGIELTNKTFSKDHIIPVSKGGGNGWKNLVPCHKDINSKKGNKSNEEANLKLLYPVVEPKKMPQCALVKGYFHVDHEQFPEIN